jgi:hypothetical protein
VTKYPATTLGVVAVVCFLLAADFWGMAISLWFFGVSYLSEA